MTSDVAFALVLLVWLALFMVFIVADVRDLCEEQLREAELERLWADEETA